MTYKIKAKNSFTGVGYSLKFVEGLAETEDGRIARMLKNKGYEVTEVKGADTIKPKVDTKAKADSKPSAKSEKKAVEPTKVDTKAKVEDVGEGGNDQDVE